MLRSAFLFALLLASPVMAQSPPSQAEIAGYTGLHAAAAQGDLGAILELARSGADPDARDGNGRTPLMVAVFLKQYAAAWDLAYAGTDIQALDNDRYDALTIAAVADDRRMVNLLLSVGASARLTTSPYDGTALIASAHLGHVEVVRSLLEAKAPLDHVNNLGWTAVIEAIVLGDGGARHQAVLKDLIDAGADVNIPDRQGQTPLALARAAGYAEMIRMLEAAGGR